jgi:hypothetical protein
MSFSMTMHVIDTSSDESDDVSEILTVVTLLVHEHEENQVQMYRGSTMGRAAGKDCKREAGHDQLRRDYSHQTDPLFKAPLSLDVLGREDACV